MPNDLLVEVCQKTGSIASRCLASPRRSLMVFCYTGCMHTDIRVAVLIEKDGKFLLGQEATKIIYGLWNWQQGKVERGEAFDVAAMREVKEETGYDVELVKKLTVLENPFPGTKEIHVYLGNIVGGELKYVKEEILDVKWFTAEQIRDMRSTLAGAWVIDVIDSQSV